MKKVSHRFITLDGMRGVAAIAVLVHHLTQHTSRRIFSGGSLAVDLFFCLSGFVIAHSYLDCLNKLDLSIGDFVMRRIVRLYPMFLCGLILGSIALLAKVAVDQTDLSYQRAIIAGVVNSFYLPYLSDFFVVVGRDKISSPVFPTNDPSWSLFFELIVNLVFALIAIRGRKIHMVAMCLLGGGRAIYMAIFNQASSSWVGYK